MTDARPEQKTAKVTAFWSGLLLGGIFGATTFVYLSTDEGQKRAKDFLKSIGRILHELEDVLEGAAMKSSTKPTEITSLPAGKKTTAP